MQVHSNFWLEEHGQVVLSEWRITLLEAVEMTGSIFDATSYKPTSVMRTAQMRGMIFMSFGR